MTGREELAETFEGFAEWCVGTSPLYERIARGVADDPELLALAAAVPEGRSPPHLLLAAVHDLLLAGQDHPLAAFYPTVADEPRDLAAEGADPVSRFRSFVDEHRDRIAERITTRRTQTNCVRRSAALYPAVAHLTRRVERPPVLIEVGTSAGLNLVFDRYAYAYDLPSGGIRTCGWGTSAVTIRAAVRAGDPPLPLEPPAVAARRGIDLDPLDPADPGDARWLRALVWPEHTERHRLLADALSVAREAPPPVYEGDALQRLPGVVGEFPDDRPVCVFDTQVCYQLDDAERDRFRATVESVAGDRSGPLWWLSGDRPAPDYERGIELRLAPGTDPDREERLLVYEQHGEWIAWTADGR